jgi:hypothetical protein
MRAVCTTKKATLQMKGQMMRNATRPARRRTISAKARPPGHMSIVPEAVSPPAKTMATLRKKPKRLQKRVSQGRKA